MSSSRIFVSYAHAGDEQGSEIARKLISDLQANHAEVVTDDTTVSDENFLAFLNRELPRCSSLIFVQSPAALKSLRVQTAVNMALTLASQQRLHSVVRLIAVPSSGNDTQLQWGAARTFDASTDYLRARDKLFLELQLIEMDPNVSFITPFSNPRLRTTGAFSSAPSGPVSVSLPQPGTYAYNAPAVAPMQGNRVANENLTLPGDDRPAPGDGNNRLKFLSALATTLKSWQDRFARRSGNSSIEQSDTILEDRPLPLKSTRQIVIRWVSVIALILVLILGTTLTVVQLRNHPSTNKHVPTPIVHSTSVPATGTPATTSTPRAFPTQRVSTIDPTSPIDRYAGGTLTLNDDLKQNDPTYQWQNGTNGTDSCTFTKNTYVMISTGPNYCLAHLSNFSNFVYQIQMHIVQGTTAGIVFRANGTNGTYYYFQITTTGLFALWRIDSPLASPVEMPKSFGFAGAINEGLKKPNLIAVRASGSRLTFFVNDTAVANVTNSTYTSGSIGVMVGQANNTSVTKATYQYAKVWTL